MMEYYWATKNNEIMPFTATQTDLEIMILNKINQVSYDIAYIWNLNKKKNWQKWTYFQIQKRLTDRKQIHGYQRERGGGEKDKLGGWD